MISQVLVEYENKDPDHVEWAKALKELYVPNLRDYVKRYYPLGIAWQPPGSANNKALCHLQFRPLLHLFPSLRAHHPTQNLECQQYLLKSALGNQWHKVSSVWVFIWFSVEQLVHLPNSCTKIMLQLLLHLLVIYTGLRKVTDDMKSKNRTDKTGVVAAEGKETRNAPSFSSTKGPAKLELQMGRK